MDNDQPFHLFCGELRALNEKEQALVWIYIAPDGGETSPASAPAIGLGSSCPE